MIFIGAKGFYDSRFYYVKDEFIYLKGRVLKIVDIFKGEKSYGCFEIWCKLYALESETKEKLKKLVRKKLIRKV